MGTYSRIYIVTGAAGHLGSTVAKILDAQGSKVYALCLPDEKNIPEGRNIRVFYGDVCSIESLSGMFDECRGKAVTVIHCAGIVSISSQFNQKYMM